MANPQQNNNQNVQGAGAAPAQNQKPVTQPNASQGQYAGGTSSNDAAPKNEAKEQGTLSSNKDQHVVVRAQSGQQNSGATSPRPSQSQSAESQPQKPAPAPAQAIGMTSPAQPQPIASAVTTPAQPQKSAQPAQPPQAVKPPDQPKPEKPEEEPLLPSGEEVKHFLTRGRVVTTIAVLLLVSFYIDKFPVKAPDQTSKSDDKNLAVISSALGTNEVDKPATVSVYFNNSLMDYGMDCAKVFPTKREVNDPSPEAALKLLLAGPTAREGDEGFFTSVSPGVPVNSVNVENDIATVNIGGHATYNVQRGSCRATAIRAQIEETMKQFTGVKSVKILVDGNANNIYAK